MENAEAEELKQLTQTVCENVAAYLGAQLDGSLESMELLQQIVLAIDRKYAIMKKEYQQVGDLTRMMEEKTFTLEDKIRSIDEIDEELTELEDMVDQLEQYTGSLQNKFYEVE